MKMRKMINFLLAIILGITVNVNYSTATQDVEMENTYLEGVASWYDYELEINGVMKEWSKTHSTCAMRDKEHRYQKFKVCADDTGVCIECYLNDYGPSRTDRVIDLSSYAFRQLGVPLKRGLTRVKIYLI